MAMATRRLVVVCVCVCKAYPYCTLYTVQD